MDANKFYDECDCLMQDLQDATMFGDALFEDAPTGYIAMSARVKTKGESRFSLESHVTDYFNETFTQMEEDFCNYVFAITGSVGNYNTKAELICGEYNKLFAYDSTGDYKYAIYRYAAIHYGVKLSFEDFLVIYDEDAEFIKQFSFKYRNATLQDIKALQGKKNVDMDLINRYSFNRLFTEPLSLLDNVNKDELVERATDARSLYDYLKEKVTGSDMMSFIGFILSHDNSCELMSYVGKVPNDIFMKYDGKCLPTIIKCYIMYGDNADFFEYYLTKYSCYDELIRNRLDNADFMTKCYSNTTEFDWMLFNALCGNVSIDRETFDSIKTRLVPPLIEKRATYNDLVYYLVANSSKSALAKYVQSLDELMPATKTVYEFMIYYFANKLSRVNETVYPKWYHLRYKSARFSFSFSDIMNHSDNIIEVIDHYNSYSTYIVSRREQGDMHLVFGEQSSLPRLQERVYTCEYSVERFLDTRPAGKFTIEQIKHYNALVHTMTDRRDFLCSLDDKEFYYYDNVIDYINRSKRYAQALTCKYSKLCVSCLRVILCYQNEQRQSLYFIYKLLSVLRPGATWIKSSVEENVENIKFFVGNKILFGANSIDDLVTSFDSAVDIIKSTNFKSASIDSGKEIIVTLER